MATVSDIIQKLQSINVYDVAMDMLHDNERSILDKNVEQLTYGLNAEGKPIGKYRNMLYAVRKHRMNPLPAFGVPDLIYTGAFTQAFKLDIAGDNLVIYSMDSKAEMLEKKYRKIFGLDDVSAKELEENIITPAIINEIQRIVGL